MFIVGINRHLDYNPLDCSKCDLKKFQEFLRNKRKFTVHRVTTKRQLIITSPTAKVVYLIKLIFEKTIQKKTFAGK